MTLTEALGYWNNPTTNFFYGYVNWHGFRRGIKPIYNTAIKEKFIEVNIENGGFVLDEITEDWVKENNLVKNFVSMVNDFKITAESMVNNLTQEINKRILERLMNENLKKNDKQRTNGKRLGKSYQRHTL